MTPKRSHDGGGIDQSVGYIRRPVSAIIDRGNMRKIGRGGPTKTPTECLVG